MKQLRIPAILSITALALAGCGTSEAEPDEPQSREEAQQEYADMLESGEAQGPPPMPAGEFELQASQGTHITFELPTDPAHEDLAAIEEYRETVNVEPVTYIVVDVDNRQGTDGVTLPQLNVYDEDGTEYEFQKLDWYFTDWQPQRSWEAEDETYWLPDETPITEDEYRALEQTHNDLEDSLTSTVSEAGRDTIIMAHQGDDLPTEFTRVALLPYGLGEAEEALPVDWNTQ